MNANQNRLGAEARDGLKEFWVWQDCTVLAEPGCELLVACAPQQQFARDRETAEAYYRIGMSKWLLAERLPVEIWIGAATVQEAA